jgi:predicted membrane-bound dolichyl-phosphate-mannose-protein mannosyltransferase
VELTQPERQRPSLHPFLKVLLAATLAELGLFVVVVVAHAASSSAALAPVADLVGISLGMTSIATLLAGVVYAYIAYPSYRLPLVFVVILAASTFAAHLYIINTPSLPACRDTTKNVNGCIMDESYYVPAAETLLNGTQCGPTVPNCNTEHPFLSKALMAAGVAAFGDNAPGWRIFDALLGTFSLPLLFFLVLRLTGSRKASYLSATLLALDVMFFSQSSAALLDVPMVFFALLAFVLYFYKVSLWKLDSFTLSGILLGLSALSKETGIFLMATLATYHLAAGEGGRKQRLFCAVEVVVVTAGVFFLGLQTYDSLLARAAFPTFLSQIHYMLSYGASLIGPGWTYGNNIQITPFSWMTYYQPVTYYGTSVSVCTNSVNGTCLGTPISYVGVAYYGVTNLIETWTTYLWMPLAAVALWEVFRPRPGGLERFGFVDTASRNLSGDTKLALLSVIWFCWNYLPYVALFAAGRVTYPFYFIPALPAVAMGASYFLTRKWVPRYASIIYLAGAFLFFFIFFPDKAFLPVWLRALIGK